MSTSLVASLLPSSVMMNSKLTCGDNSSYHSFNVGPMPAASLCTGITICKSGIMFDPPPFHCRFAETRCAICGEDGQIKTEVLLARTIDLVLTDDAIDLICFLNREKQSRMPSGGVGDNDHGEIFRFDAAQKLGLIPRSHLCQIPHVDRIKHRILPCPGEQNHVIGHNGAWRVGNERNQLAISLRAFVVHSPGAVRPD